MDGSLLSLEMPTLFDFKLYCVLRHLKLNNLI